MSNKNSFVLILALLMPCTLWASDLVDVDWLDENTNNTKVIDLRSSAQFQSGHIPKAINIAADSFSRIKNNIAGFVITPIAFQSLMEEHGIKNSDLIVLYSDWSFLDSMRIYWVMDFYGHKNIKVLNGGLQAWTEAKKELSIEQQTIQKSQYIIEINSEILTTKFRTFMASKNPDYVIVDGRNSNQFSGEESLTKRKGHIPNAMSVPWPSLVQNRTQKNKYDKLKSTTRFEDIDVLKERLSIIPKDKKIILYCNNGQETSVLYFALKELGVSASVYDGSWYEWSNDQNMPISSHH